MFDPSPVAWWVSAFPFQGGGSNQRDKQTKAAVIQAIAASTESLAAIRITSMSAGRDVDGADPKETPLPPPGSRQRSSRTPLLRGHPSLPPKQPRGPRDHVVHAGADNQSQSSSDVITAVDKGGTRSP